MTARGSFLLCLTLSSVPLIVGVFGLYQFATLQTAASAEATAISEVCVLAYRRTVDTAGHVVIYGALGLFAVLLLSCGLTIMRGWQETRRIRNIRTELPDSSRWQTVEDFRKCYLPASRVELFRAPEPMAITVGYFSPRILVSTGLLDALDDQEIEAVLHHEAAHVANRDPLRTFLSDACRTALPFIPIVRFAASQFDVKKELEADATAIKMMGSPAPLASALAKVIAGMPGEPAVGVGISPTEARIDALLGRALPDESRRGLILLGALSLPAAAALSAGFYFLAHAPHITALHICPK